MSRINLQFAYVALVFWMVSYGKPIFFIFEFVFFLSSFSKIFIIPQKRFFPVN